MNDQDPRRLDEAKPLPHSDPLPEVELREDEEPKPGTAEWAVERERRLDRPNRADKMLRPRRDGRGIR